MSKHYWMFDWEDMGTKDTPAVIDFILQRTGFKQLSYIGHSEGTTQIMAGASLMPEFYKEKLKVCIFLAPPASMIHNRVKINKILAKKPFIELMMKTLDKIQFWNLLP